MFAYIQKCPLSISRRIAKIGQNQQICMAVGSYQKYLFFITQYILKDFSANLLSTKGLRKKFFYKWHLV